jgi:enamine deaminase RidA (YjgF/YER057c/UK114 family)
VTKLFMFPALAALAMSCRAPARVEPPPDRPPSRPQLFGAGLFSTSAWDFFIAFSPDQTRALFGRADDAFEHFAIHESRIAGRGRWSQPTRPRFAGPWSDADPHISPDGRSVYFISNRPLSGAREPRPVHDIFVAKLDEDGEWGEATRLPEPVNDGTTDRWSPSVTRSGDLYFGAELPGTRGGSDLWVSHLVDGVHQPPVQLGDAINTAAHEVEPWIAPDGSYLIFAALRRSGGAGGYDLFISRRIGAAWTPAEPLRVINTPASEWNHSVSPDGHWLYFTSTRARTGPIGERFDTPRDERLVEGIGNGKGDIYRIAMEDVMTDHRAVSIAPGGAYASAYEVSGPTRTVYISGQIPVRPDGTVPDGFEAQCRQVWANIDAVLAQAGMTRRDLVKVTTYLSDRRDRDVNSRIRRELLGDHLPALTIIIVGIYDPEWLLEIEAIAAR